MGVMLGIYRPDAVTAVAMVVGATATYFAALYGKRFERHVASAYASLMWSSGLFILFFLTYFVVESGQNVWGPALYAIYMVLGVSVVAIIGAKDYAAVMQNTRADYVLMGIGLGILAAWLAYAVPLQVAPLIGSATLLSAGDFATGLFIIMLYVVAIPEEFMGRVFAFHAGATTVDLFSASVATAVLGYALHAVTRYPDTAVLAIITLVWSAITAYYAMTRCLFGSVLMHAVYNTMIVLMTEFGALPVFIPSLIAAIVIFGYVAKKVVK
jgi:membrane protease YdiL (CAAX protease family)